METSLRQKDRAYKYAFKGSVLVNSLLENEAERFGTRVCALRFAQHLVEAGHVVSVVGGAGDAVFEDSARLYRWADESVVRAAKKLVETTGSHVPPRRRLVEMPDARPAAAAAAAGDNREASSAASVGGAITRLRAQLEALPGDASAGAARTEPQNLTIFFGGAASYTAVGDDDDEEEEVRGEEEDEEEELGYREEPESPQPSHVYSGTGLSDADSGYGATEFGDTPGGDTPHKPTPDDVMSPTCRYDGVDMPALDLDNIRLAVLQPTSAGSDADDATRGYSANEKRLLEQVRRMRVEHETLVSGYESRIDELTGDVSALTETLSRARGDERLRDEAEITLSPAFVTSAGIVSAPSSGKRRRTSY